MTKITDTWEGNLASLAWKHLVPGFWDIWHQLGSPPAEQQPYKVLAKKSGYEIREYVPRLVLQPSVIDRSNSREVRMGFWEEVGYGGGGRECWGGGEGAGYYNTCMAFLLYLLYTSKYVKPYYESGRHQLEQEPEVTTNSVCSLYAWEFDAWGLFRSKQKHIEILKLCCNVNKTIFCVCYCCFTRMLIALDPSSRCHEEKSIPGIENNAARQRKPLTILMEMGSNLNRDTY